MLSKRNIILVCVSIIIVVLIVYYLYKKQKKSTCKIITPQCLLGALSTNSRVLVVNVLSDKMPVFIGIENPDPSRSISKSGFEEVLKNNNNHIPKDIDLVILMCAGWSCSAAKNYCDDLNNRGVDVSRVVDYAGGLHEWCLYNKLNSSVFKLFGLENNMELDQSSIGELLKNTAHGYKTNTLVDENKMPISEFCKQGNSLPDLLSVV
jgi:hypothetical protein